MERRGVALGGFMGVGKTTVGRRLADRLGLPFADTDALLAARHGPIPAQFEAEGEAAFRAREAALIAELCDGTPRVVATGGGVWVASALRDLLAADHRLVVLTASLATLRARVGQASGRPLWAEAERLLAERAPAYAQADLTVATDGRSIEEVVERIVQGLGRSS